MRALVWLMVMLVMLGGGAAVAKGRAPVGEIRLEAEGRLQYMGYCAATRYLVATVDDGKGIPHSAGAKTKTALYQLDLDKRRANKLGPLSEAHEFAFNSDCSLVALGVTTGRDATQNNEVHVYRLSSTAAPVRLVAFGGFAFPVGALAFVDDKTLAVGFNAGALELWSFDRAGKALPLAKQELSESVMSLATAGGLLAIGTYKGSLLLERVVDGKLAAVATLLGKSPNHRDSGSLDVDTGKIVVPGGGRIFELAFAAKGSRLFASQESGRIASWPIANGTPGKLEVVAAKLGAVTAMAVSPDDQLVAVGDDKRVTVWRTAGDKLVTELDKLDHVEEYAAFNGVLFVGPRDLLVGAYFSATVRLYRVN